MSESQEVALGQENDATVRKEMGLYGDTAWQTYVNGVGQRLAHAAHRPSLSWHFAVVDEPAVNAFALPGGFIYVTRGILPFLHDEAELAAVMGHEVGHVDARHAARAYSEQTLAGGGLALLGIFVPETRPATGLASVGLGALFLKNSRDDELQADSLGVGYMSAAGWDPSAMPDLLNTLGRLDEATGSRRGVPNWTMTHPPAEDRVARVQQAVAAARSSAATATNRAEYERHLDGLIFGDSREKGVVRGNEFLHPILRVALRFPVGWDITNSDQQVAARESGSGGGVMVLQMSPSGGARVEDAARAQMQRRGLVEASGAGATINGLPAYVGTYDGTSNGARVRVRAAHIQSNGQLYFVAGLAPFDQFAQLEPAFNATIRSFRALSREAADDVQPGHIDFYAVRAGDTWASIAHGPSNDNVKASTLAIMNGQDPATPPAAGQRVRIVAGG